MNEELYQKKHQYEKLIKELNELYDKLEKGYSNLILSRNKIINTITIDDNYYNNKLFEKIIDITEENKNKVKNIILPTAKNKYNEIISAISKL